MRDLKKNIYRLQIRFRMMQVRYYDYCEIAVLGVLALSALLLLMLSRICDLSGSDMEFLGKIAIFFIFPVYLVLCRITPRTYRMVERLLRQKNLRKGNKREKILNLALIYLFVYHMFIVMLRS